MPWTTADIPDQSGRVVLVTGASSGLGLETARALLSRGATVLLGCRSPRRGEQARRQLLASTGAGAADLLHLDLADLAGVRACAAAVAGSYGRLDLLINNAGVMAPPRTVTRDGFELQFGVNHLGHFALTLALLPLLDKQAGARVVTVTSGAQHFGRLAFDDLQATRRYDRWAAYAQSKLANVMMTLELQRRLQERGSSVLALAAHPGLARTNLQPASIAATGNRWEGLAYRLLDPLFQSAAQGALPQLHAATAPDVVPAGHYGPDQLGGLRGWPQRQPVARAARDPEACRRLWQVSEDLVAAQNPVLPISSSRS
ncbi:MAG: oxidoreductase [Cyanobacteriota bacterium]|jgi:protochlorophyllide reductase